MYHHVKKLMFTVRVDAPDPKFGNMLLEQFGGANGELAAAMQYSIQGLNCEDAERKDLLMDIGTEELSHLEIVGTLARMHLAPMKFKRQAAEADPPADPENASPSGVRAAWWPRFEARLMRNQGSRRLTVVPMCAQPPDSPDLRWCVA